MTHTVRIDGREVELPEGRSLLAGALEAGMYIPHLCHHPDLPPGPGVEPAAAVWRAGDRIEHDGDHEAFDGCGLCWVEVDGSDEPVRSCDLEISPGLVVMTDSPALRSRRRQALARIFAHHPHACVTCAQKEGCSREPCSTNVPEVERCCPLLGRCELEKVAAYVGLPPDTPRYVPRNLPGWQDSLFVWEPELCIGCLRCVRACSALKGVEVLGWVRRAGEVVVGRLAPDDDDTCRYCGACVEVCPTGTITDRNVPVAERERRLVPCRSGCPAGMDVPRFLRAVADDRLEDAARVVLDTLPLPHSLGRVCFHPCEEGCRRAEMGGSLSVSRLRRRVFESVEASSDAWPAAADTGRRVAVIGSGPAGLSAAHFLRRKGHRVNVFEAAPQAGGMLRYGIPSYRLPREVLERDLELIGGQGVEIRTGMALGREIELEQLRDEGYDAVLVAAGAGAARPLPVDGVELDGVLHGVQFLCDVSCGSFPVAALNGRVVVVIGGGNVALDAARTALRLGAASVTVACLEAREAMPAYPEEVDEALAEGITVLDSWGPSAITGASGAVSGVTLVRCTTVFDDDGRFAPTFDDGTTRGLDADTVIVAVGQEVEPALRDHPDLAFGDHGLLAVDAEELRAGDGVFGTGDLVLGPSSVVQAVANARRAASAIDRHLGGDGEIPSIVEAEEPSQWLGRVEGFAGRERKAPATLDREQRTAGFAEVESTLGSDEAAAEAGRCLQCDLRLAISAPVLPPPPWLELSDEAVAKIPAVEGVYQLLGSDRVATKIVGTADLARALCEELAADSPGPFFVYESDPMYTKRESELIQQFLAEHGRMPAGGDDDLDDLF